MSVCVSVCVCGGGGVATYLKVGGHTYEGAERPSLGRCGRVPPHTVRKIFHFQEP